MDTAFVRSCVPDGPRHHEEPIGATTASDGRIRRFGGVVAVLDPPHRPVNDPHHRLSRDFDTTVTAFTGGDKTLRGCLGWEHKASMWCGRPHWPPDPHVPVSPQ